MGSRGTNPLRIPRNDCIYLAKYVYLLIETDMQYAAKVYRDDRLRRKADALSMDNCKELERLTSIYKGG